MKLIQLNDKQVPKILQLQNLDKTSKHFGGVCDNWIIYNPHSSAGLIKTMSVSYSSEQSKYYHDESLIEPMVLAAKYLLKIQHSDGTIDLLSTNFHSTPDTAFVMEHYYLPYKMAATRGKGKPEFWALVNLIEKTVPEKLLTYLPSFMINPWISTDFHKKEGGTVPDNYVKEFRGSNLVRIRRRNIDATILGNNPTFLTVNKGNAVLASVRLASAVFGCGQFKSKTVEKLGDSFVLKWEFHWGYFQPLPQNQKPNYEIPFDEDRKRRMQSERQSLFAQIKVSEKDGIFELDFELNGTENIPLATEFAFRKGGILSGVEKQNETGTYLLKEGTAKYSFENDLIEFGPGLAEHEWTAIRGGLPKPDGECVYITGFTPFKHNLKIG